ncbi:MAG: class I SAM-dependent methyltransferase [Corallococcus sp.]|nr:class I SAM-dependent methyltransferase [Corallococcus sp.]MCM1359377.1 class I SAM-dependent methyltransferase [Corallococcus sp.]MCM1394820.1 class I SAM-dependent methyltransferase [Corallococcus sp.]
MLTVRLEKILSAVPQCNVLADVGCDHGYVGIGALERGVARRVIFCDISEPSLEKARQNCPEALKARAEFVCRDGLGNIECDCAVIAGMGGLEIISVLNAAEHLPNTLVLSPMRNQQDVRKWLSSRCKILSDEKFFDGKYYDLIVAQVTACGAALTDDEVKFGKTNIRRPTKDFATFLQKEREKYEKIRRVCKSADVEQKYADVCRISEQIEPEDKK